MSRIGDRDNDSTSSYFKISINEIGEIFEDYQHRKFDEDLTRINALGGIEAIAANIKTNMDMGLDFNNEKDLDKRKDFFSENTHEEPETVSFWDLLLEAFGDTFIQILIVAAVVQISIGLSPLAQSSTDWIDGMAIVFAIVIVVLTSSVTNYNKELKFRELSQHNEKMFKIAVLRNGKAHIISSDELLVGDIVKLDYGMILPVDGLLITGESVSVNEACITGESYPVFKEVHSKCLNKKVHFRGEKTNNSLPSPVLISSTVIESGSGWFLVVAVGKNSVKGKINTIVFNSKTDAEEKTPLELKLEDIAEDIGKFGLYSAILTFIALSSKLCYSKFQQYRFLSSLNTEASNGNSTENASNNNTVFSNSTQTNSNSTLLSNSTSEGQSNLYDPSQVFVGVHKEVLTILMLCVAIIVVAIPEGLPLAVTLALSFSVRKMMDDNNLVRHLSACETMGGATYILSDKTGTLTKNQMVVEAVYNNSQHIDLSEVKKAEDNFIKPNPLAYFSERYYQIIKEGIITNSDVEMDENSKQIRGSKTDFALYSLLLNFGEDCRRYKEGVEIKERLPFHSDRKRMSSLLGQRRSNFTNISASNDVDLVHMKGAVEYILNSCDSYIDPLTGEKKALNKNIIENINKQCELYYSRALRCIGLAYKEIPRSQVSKFKETVQIDTGTQYTIEQEKFSFIGVFAITDGVKNNVPNAVDNCVKAGVRVIMITGDNPKTAVAVAKECNIVTPNDREDFALTGDVFYTKVEGVQCSTCNQSIDYCRCKTLRQLQMETVENKDKDNNIELNCQKLKVGNIEAFKSISSKIKVLARARPIDKFAMVLGLRELDHVVAVTGDGSNDAPALSIADVGFSMGIQGTEAAKNASDIIILDDNFSSIVSSIKWGRSIFDNIKKFIQFQLSVNLAAVLLVFVTSCIGSESPISAIQMLWLNLIMDSLGSLALATEAPSDDLLSRKPYSKREYIVSRTMWKHIIIQSIFQFTIIFFLYIYAEKFVVEEHPDRIKVYSQLENCFGDFGAAYVKYHKSSLVHYIIDGKKSSWNPLHLIKKDLSPEYCMFYDTSRFQHGQIRNLEHAYKWYVSEYGNTTHMTIVFNCFVLYSLFNQINSRILDESLNIFKRIQGNLLFLAVVLTELIVQVILVEYGGIVFKCSIGGLTTYQWGVCLAFASVTFWVSIFTKFIKFEKFFSGVQSETPRKVVSEKLLKENLIQGENKKDVIENALGE